MHPCIFNIDMHIEVHIAYLPREVVEPNCCGCPEKLWMPHHWKCSRPG